MRRQIPRSSNIDLFPFKFRPALLPYLYLFTGLFAFGAICLCFTGRTEAQAPVFPDKIHGYKVHRETISVNTGNDPKSNRGEEAFIKVSPPQLKNVALSGITFELSAEVLSPRQSAKIDFLTFNDMFVNGVGVKIEDYRYPFSITKNEPANLPNPASIMLSSTGILHAAWKE